jgi:hypothetical protein
MFRNEHALKQFPTEYLLFEALSAYSDAQPFPHLLCHLSEQTHLGSVEHDLIALD